MVQQDAAHPGVVGLGLGFRPDAVTRLLVKLDAGGAPVANAFSRAGKVRRCDEVIKGNGG